MENKVFEIIFDDGNVINRKIKIEETSCDSALVVFHTEHPNAMYKSIKEVQK